MNIDAFPESVVKKYRIQRERLVTDPAEFEETIPLTGGRGHIYFYGPGWCGVWLNTGTPTAMMKRLKADFPNLVVQQVAAGECTFRVPMSDLDKLLPVLRPFRRRRLSDERRTALVAAGKATRFSKPRGTKGSSGRRRRERCPGGVSGGSEAEMAA